MKYTDASTSGDGVNCVDWYANQYAEAMIAVLEFLERYLQERGKPIEFTEVEGRPNGIRFSVEWDGVEL